MLNVKAISFLSTYSAKNTLASQPNQSNSPVYLNQPAKDEVSFKGVKGKLAEALARGAKPLTELLEAAKAKGEDEITKEISAFLAKRKLEADKIYFLDELKDGRLFQRELINSKGKTIRLSQYSEKGKLKLVREYISKVSNLKIYREDGSILVQKRNGELIEINPDGSEKPISSSLGGFTTALPQPKPRGYERGGFTTALPQPKPEGYNRGRK